MVQYTPGVNDVSRIQEMSDQIRRAKGDPVDPFTVAASALIGAALAKVVFGRRA